MAARTVTCFKEFMDRYEKFMQDVDCFASSADGPSLNEIALEQAELLRYVASPEYLRIMEQLYKSEGSDRSQAMSEHSQMCMTMRIRIAIICLTIEEEDEAEHEAWAGSYKLN